MLNDVQSIEDFLRQIHLEKYIASVQTHFKNLSDFMANLNLEDLEEIGVKKLGHQKNTFYNFRKQE
jgi:hypothetical protein